MFERFIHNLEKRTLVYVLDVRRLMSSIVIVEKFCQKNDNLTQKYEVCSKLSLVPIS